MTSDDPHRRHTSTPEELKALQELKRTGCAFVAWRDDGLKLRALDPTAARTTIGRAPSSAITLSDAAASALHAEIIRIDEEWVIADDGLSTNGTFVSGRRIFGRTRLRDEDRIRVGTTVLVFHFAGGGAVRTAPAGNVVERTDLSDTEFRVLKALCRPLVLSGGHVPATNKAIMEEVHMTVDGVKRCLTRLYQAYRVAGSSAKRLELADAAINSGLIDSHSYS